MGNIRAVFAIFLGAVGCQSYEFNQVAPQALGAMTQGTVISGLAQPSKIMLVLDRSSSMKTHVNDENAGCCLTGNGGSLLNCQSCTNYDPTIRDCKWNSLKHLLLDQGGFLDVTKDYARFSLATFPGTDCSASDLCTDGFVNVGSAAGNNVEAIKNELSPLAPHGGTPTANMLNAIVGDDSFTSEAVKHYVVLVTDGLPNCNKDLNGSTCTCTGGSCPTDPRNCLDDERMVKGVADLKEKGVLTFVIGFGTGTVNPAALSVLNRAAEAGGQAQQNASTKYYQASSEEDMQKILDMIVLTIQPCTFDLAKAPASENLLEVTLSDTQGTFDSKCANLSGKDCRMVRGTDWDFMPSTLSSVAIKGEWCVRLQSASANRYKLNFVSLSNL
jgi:hypothetical protein